MERLLLIIAALFYLLSFGRTLHAFRTKKLHVTHFNFAAILLGFTCVTASLYFRGQTAGTCPITSLFDVLIFLSWSIVLIYLLIGPAYRLSLMGAFTAPLVLLIMLLALIVPSTSPSPRVTHPMPAVEFHAALSVISFGAFGLACIAGIMYLVQERQIKACKGSNLLYSLPPISDLGTANNRLILTGFLLLTIAFGIGFLAGLPVASAKFIVSVIIWSAYGTILLLGRLRFLVPRRIATLSITVFIFALIALPLIQGFSVAAAQ